MPVVTLSDHQLKSGMVYTDAMGLPRPVTGSFASVYRLHCPENDFALRLFLRNIQDQEERYALISDFVQHDDLPYTVTFDFLKNGIKIFGEWLPALKMEWVEGQPFDDYIVDHLANPAKLGELLTKFQIMMKELRRAGIAHGDLQHGNIIMCNEELRLVDYDGMFVPKMAGYCSNELGHRNYQHPERSAQHFGPYLDNFSAWVIYTSIRALQIDSRFLHQLGGGDDCLLFRQTDFIDPLHSPAFTALEKYENAELNSLARFIRAQLKVDPAHVPCLELPVPAVALEPLSGTASTVRSGPRLVRGNLPEWLQEDNAESLINNNVGNSAPHKSAAAAHKPYSWTVSAKPTPTQWNKPKQPSTLPSMNAFMTALNAAPGTAHVGLGSQNISASQPAVTAPVPPELSLARPRTVKFYESCGRVSPHSLQWLMVFNPLVWMMIFFCHTTFITDNDLRLHGVDYPATVTKVERYYSKGQHTNVTFKYQVGERTLVGTDSKGEDNGFYKEGQQRWIHALPSQPTLTEPLDLSPGSKQNNDFFILAFTIFVNCILELAIWLPAMMHKRLAQTGVPLVGTIDELKIDTGSKGEKYYKAIVSYWYAANLYCETIGISLDEYNSLVIGSKETIICDEKYPKNFAIYRFCRYHPVMPTTLTPHITPLSTPHTANLPPSSQKRLRP